MTFSERRCTIMAMLIIVTFVIFNVVASINNLLEAWLGDPDPEEEPVRFVWQRVAVILGNLLVCANSSSNFCIYCLFGRRFRQMCALIFCPCLVEKSLGYHSLLLTTNGGARSTHGSDVGGSAARDIFALRKLAQSRRTVSTDQTPVYGSNGSSSYTRPSPASVRRKRSADAYAQRARKKYSDRLSTDGNTERVI